MEFTRCKGVEASIEAFAAGEEQRLVEFAANSGI